jgi:hypothetical protein
LQYSVEETDFRRHNGSVIHGSIERVADLIESLLQVSVELATISSRQQGAKSPVENVEKIVERLNQADKERAKNQQVTYSEPDDFTIDLLGRHKALEIAAIRTDDLMPSLELFLPAFRTRLQFVHKDSGEQFLSKEAAHWLSSEFYGLISDVYTAAERSHAHFLTEEQNPDTNFKALMPRRFHRLTNLPNSSAKDDGDKQLSAPREVADSVSCIQAEHADILRYDCKLKIPSGRLCSYFESTHWSKAGPVFDSQSGRVSIAFVPKFELGIPGIGVSFMKQHGYLQPSQQSFLSIFNILPGNAPIIREVKDGDCGVSRVLQKLKAGESWAGDRDENGRSLLSVSYTL